MSTQPVDSAITPAFPLDGGRIARAALWRDSGDIHRATETAARLGRVFGYLMIAFGIVLAFEGAPGGLWISLIGMFVIASARAKQLQDEIVTEFTGVEAQQLMSRPAVSIDGAMGLDEARERFGRYHYTAFPVTDAGGRAIGIVSIKQLDRTPHPGEGSATVAQVANRDRGLIVGEREDVAHLLEDPAFASVGRAAVVDDSGHAVGLLSITDVQREIQAGHLGGGSSASNGGRTNRDWRDGGVGAWRPGR